MNYKEKIDFLNQYFYATKSIENLERELEKWHTLGTNISSVSDGMPHNHEGNSKVESSAIKLAEITAKIDNQIKAICTVRDSVVDVINSVSNPRHRMLLDMRYIGFQSFSKIAKNLNKSERNIYNMHKSIIEKLKI